MDEKRNKKVDREWENKIGKKKPEKPFFRHHELAKVGEIHCFIVAGKKN